MTQDARPLSDEPLPCPFCGKSVAKLTTASELADEPDDYSHSESWAVICDASGPGGPGGCGASGGFFQSEAEAMAAWNRRASQRAPLVLPPEPGQWEKVETLVRQIHEATKRGRRTQDHGLFGNLRCILDHVSPCPDLDAAPLAPTQESGERDVHPAQTPAGPSSAEMPNTAAPAALKDGGAK